MKNFFIIILCLGFIGSDGIWAQEKKILRREDSFLGVHFDFHANKNDSTVGKNTSPQMIQSIIDIVHPDYIQTDCKGHPGYSSYPTNVGNRAPRIFGDPLKIWREVTEQNGVALYMHYSGVWDTRAVELHPEYAVINSNGVIDSNKTSVFGNYVDELLIPQLKELASRYKVDGVWIDGECWATVPDYGEKAKRLFIEESGLERIPGNPMDADWNKWIQFQREGFRKYLRHYLGAVRSEYPGFQIASNWAYTQHMPETVSSGVDFLSGDYSPNNSVNSARYAGRFIAQQGLPWDLMAWSFSYAPYPREQKTAIQLKREAAVVLALGGGFQAYFTQNRDGSVRLEELKVMGEVAKFARARQPWCQYSVQIPQVGMLFSNSDYEKNAKGIFPQYKGASQGILENLLENQYSVDIICEDNTSSGLSRFPIIVIPEWTEISINYRQELLNYVKGGGKLLVIGKTASREFSDLIKFDLKDGIYTEMDFGRGLVGFLPTDIGNEYEKTNSVELRNKLSGAVSRLFPNPMVEVIGSNQIDLSISKSNGRQVIHLINTSGDHKKAGIIKTISPIGPILIKIRLSERPKKILLQPEGKECPFEYSNGVARVDLKQLKIYDILEIY